MSVSLCAVQPHGNPRSGCLRRRAANSGDSCMNATLLVVPPSVSDTSKSEGSLLNAGSLNRSKRQVGNRPGAQFKAIYTCPQSSAASEQMPTWQAQRSGAKSYNTSPYETSSSGRLNLDPGSTRRRQWLQICVARRRCSASVKPARVS